MATLRIANIITHEADRSQVSQSIWRIPPEIIAPGFSVGEVALARRQSMLNDLDRTIMELTYVEAGIRAEKAGYDAIYISPVADYGMRELRAAVSIPVIGAGQATMQVAAGLCGRFAVVTVWPPILRRAYQRQLAEYGYEGLCSGLYFVTSDEELPAMVGDENGQVWEMGRTRRGALVDRIEQVARRAMEDGTQGIVLGCTCMSPIRDELAARLGGAVIFDPFVTGYKYAEMLLSLGVTHPAAVPSLHAGNMETVIGAIDYGAPAEDACGASCAVLEESLVA
jgi:allantoin racemase